jgi:5'-nucleotidase
MRVLVTNDDGIDSPGLRVLVEVAVAAGHDVVVAAPAHEYSGASASLHGASEDGRLEVARRTMPGVAREVPAFAVGAAPALIAYYAAFGAFGPKPELMLSGVNRGQNTGHLLLHSGTAGAVLAGALHGIRGVAFSLASAAPEHWLTAGRVAAPVLAWAVEHAPTDRVLNVNVPDVAPDRVRGLRQAPLARLGAVQARVETTSGQMRLTYADVETFAGTDAVRDDETGVRMPEAPGDSTDAVLLARGWATVSMIRAPADDPAALVPTWDGPPPAAVS